MADRMIHHQQLRCILLKNLHGLLDIAWQALTRMASATIIINIMVVVNIIAVVVMNAVLVRRGGVRERGEMAVFS